MKAIPILVVAVFLYACAPSTKKTAEENQLAVLPEAVNEVSVMRLTKKDFYSTCCGLKMHNCGQYRLFWILQFPMLVGHAWRVLSALYKFLSQFLLWPAEKKHICVNEFIISLHLSSFIFIKLLFCHIIVFCNWIRLLDKNNQKINPEHCGDEK